MFESVEKTDRQKAGDAEAAFNFPSFVCKRCRGESVFAAAATSYGSWRCLNCGFLEEADLMPLEEK